MTTEVNAHFRGRKLGFFAGCNWQHPACGKSVDVLRVKSGIAQQVRPLYDGQAS
jgi:hypothetical protein